MPLDTRNVLGAVTAALVLVTACGELPMAPEPIRFEPALRANWLADGPAPTSPVLCGSPGTFCVNAGGPRYTDATGNVFAPDKPYTAGSYGSIGGFSAYINTAISGTSDPDLYRSLRSSDHGTGDPFIYIFDNVSDGEYEITLYFMEPSFGPGAARQRIFDIYVEGELILDDFNPGVAAGAIRTAVQVTVTATVSDGQLEIEFVEQSKEQYNTVPIVSAIKVASTTPPPALPATRVTPAAVDFGGVVTGGSAERTITVSNDGTADLAVSDLTVDDATFEVLDPTAPFVVGPGTSRIITLRFSAGDPGTYGGTLDITSDDPDTPVTRVALSGISEPPPPPPAPVIEVTPSSVDFGTVTIGSFADRTVLVTNVGNANLEVTGLTVTGDAFALVGPAAPFVVAPGGSETVTLRFSSDIAQAENGTLEIASNAADAPVVAVALAGTGAEEPPPQQAWRMNGGGAEYTASTGKVFGADQPYTATDFGFIGGSLVNGGGPISGTPDPELYLQLHGAASFAFAADVPDGSYEVTLHFSEFYWTRAGERTFDVFMEGTRVLEAFDIFAAAGGFKRAVTRTFNVIVNDGQLNIEFVGVRRQAIVSAIEIVAN